MLDRDLVNHLEFVEASPGSRLSNKLPEDHSKAENVALGRDAPELIIEAFRGHVSDCSCIQFFCAEVSLVLASSQAKVRYLGHPIICHEDIAWLQIPVDNVEGMKVDETSDNVEGKGNDNSQGQWTLPCSPPVDISGQVTHLRGRERC